MRKTHGSDEIQRYNIDKQRYMSSITEDAVKLIAIYARVSTARQEDENTIETQLLAIRDFAHTNGYAIVREYIDDGWSGDMLARPGLDQLRHDAKKKLWEGVLFYDPDRLARRYSFQELVMDELRELRIEPLFVTVPPSRNHEDRLLYGVRGVFAEYERMKITERFRLGKVRKAREGHIIAAEAPYGYALIPRRGKPGETEFSQTHYEINEPEANVVRKIFSLLVDERLTLRKVAKRLQHAGIPPRKSKRMVWSTSTLATLIRNRTYIGEAHYGASYAVVPERPFKKDGYRRVKKTSRRMKPEEEWIKIPTPILIERPLFDRAQRQLKENSVLGNRNRKNEYLLSGKIRCICGNARCGEGPQGGRYLYYRCSSREYNYPLPPTCTERGINARIADALVWDQLVRLMSSPDLMRNQAERWMAKGSRNLHGPRADLAAIEMELEKLRDEQNRYAKAYGAGLFGLDQLKEYAAPVKARIRNLENQIANARSNEIVSVEPSLPEPHEVDGFAEHAGGKLEGLNFEGRRAIVLRVVNKVVGTQEKLNVTGCLPIGDHVKSKTNDRHGGDATQHIFEDSDKGIPFTFTIKLPPPDYRTARRALSTSVVLTQPD
jgi:site-specific DNA recombinase